ncbi:MAG: SH3 domain-containing protein [Aggregatilineales bacterium]
MRRYSLIALGFVALMFLCLIVLTFNAINRSNNPSQVETVLFEAQTLQDIPVWSINDLLTGTQVDTLTAETVVDVLEGPRQGQVTADDLEDWYRVRAGNITGWVRGQFLDLAFGFDAGD